MKVQSATACSRCGTALALDAPEGLCPRCLLRLNLEQPTEASQAGPHGTVVAPTRQPALSPGEIAQYFPQLQIMECLGRGGMGVVYKARQISLNRLVALKLIVPERKDDPSFAERFLREAQALAHLSHPNIVTVHDFGQANELYYLIMEFVDGVSLRELLKDGKLAPEQAMALVPKICGALQYAHEQGVIHRDIKPENLLLDRKGQVKIADFGIAKVLDERRAESLTAEKQVIGTPHYMAPEQVENPQRVDHRADIYSLGVVFYEMLTGELPLGKFQAPSKKVQVDIRLDEVVLKALEKEPERRYQHASEVKQDVETIATSPAVELHPGRLGAAEWRATLALTAVVLCSILAGVGAQRGTYPIMLACLPGLVIATLVLIGRYGNRSKARPAIALQTWAALAVLIGSGVAFGVGVGVKSSTTQVVAAATMIGAALALSGAFQRFTRLTAIKPEFRDRVTRAVPIVRWIARALGTASLVFYGIFIVAEGLPVIASAPTGVQLNFAALGLMLGGYIVGWGRDGTAAVLIASGWALWQLSEGAIRWNLFQTPIPIAALYAWCWWADHRRNTARVLTVIAVLTVFLGVGLAARNQGPVARAASPEAATLEIPPVVISTDPPSGATGVDASLREIRVTFSKRMQPGGWSWVRAGDGSNPEMTGEPSYLPDQRTCVLPVRLQPGQTCALWINTHEIGNFRDDTGKSALPYLLIFETRQRE